MAGEPSAFVADFAGLSAALERLSFGGSSDDGAGDGAVADAITVLCGVLQSASTQKPPLASGGESGCASVSVVAFEAWNCPEPCNFSISRSRLSAKLSTLKFSGSS